MSGVSSTQRYTASSPCPICSGWDRAPRGQSVRCWGFISSDGLYAHCQREDHAGKLQPHRGPNGGETYAHRLEGPCRCGATHRPAREGAEVRAIGESSRARIVAHYDYRWADGRVAYQVVRKEPKAFLQRRPDPAVRGEWIWGIKGLQPLLYRLPEVIAAVEAGDPVWIVEGEADADALDQLDQVATCNSGGAGKFPADMAQYLRGADVTIVQDRDDAGRKHAQDVRRKVERVAKSVRIVEARSGNDTRDHLAAGHSLQQFSPVWPESTLRSDPIAWKRAALRAGLQVGNPFERKADVAALGSQDEAPKWPSGIKGACDLSHFQGVTLVSGAPGAAKSYLALSSSLDAALYGSWDVVYLSAEMSPTVVSKRVMAYLRMQPPESWHLVDVGAGATLDGLTEYLCGLVTERKLLVVFDSLSSFIDQGLVVSDETDAFGMLPLKRTIMWMVNVRKATDGEVSFLALSELSASGFSRGRFGDHKVDLGIKMEREDGDDRLRYIEPIKGWAAPVGNRIRLMLDWRTATLEAVGLSAQGDDDD